MEDYKRYVKSSMQKYMLSSQNPALSQGQLQQITIQKMRRMDEKFPVLVRTLLQIGSNLVIMKELRDFLIDILEKFGDVLHKFIKFTPLEIFQFCDCLVDSMCELRVMEAKDNLIHINAWSSFMCVVRDVTTRMFHTAFQGDVQSCNN